MNTFGLEIVLPIPKLSKAVISAFSTPAVVLLSKPIPLVAPVTGKFDKVSDIDPKPAAVPGSNSVALPVLVPAKPPATEPSF